MLKQLGQYQESSTSPMVAARDEPGNGHDDHSSHQWSADPRRYSAGRSSTASLEAKRLARFLILLAGCFWGFATSADMVSSESQVPQRTSWQQINHPSLDFLFVRPAVEFTGYRSVIIDPVSIWYSNDSALTAQEVESNLDELRLRFHGAFAQALENSGYEIVDVPHHDALRLHVEIIDLGVNRATANVNPWRDRFLFRVLPGHITLVAELADSTTGEVLLRIADLDDSAGDRFTTDFMTAWENVDVAFDMWSAMISQTISHDRTNGDMFAEVHAGHRTVNGTGN